MHDTYEWEMFRKGLQAMEREQVFLALSCLERADGLKENPLYRSSLGYCMASTRNAFDEAIRLCRDAVARECGNPVHYLHLGRTYVLSGQLQKAIETFREGLKRGRDPRLVRELANLGTRKPPLFPSLRRNHPLNKYGGLLMSRLGYR